MKTNNQVNEQFGQEYVKFMLTKYLKNWYWFVIAVVVSGLVTYLLLTTIKPMYSIQSSLLVNMENSSSSSPKEDILRELDIFSSSKNIEDEIEILKSYTLAEKVVNDLNLDVNYSVKDGLHERDIYKQSPVTVTVIEPNKQQNGKTVEATFSDNGLVINGVTYPFNRPVNTIFGRILIRRNNAAIRPFRQILLTTNSKEEVVKSYISRLRVNQASRSSYVLRINLEDTSVERGVAFINRLIHWYDLSSLQYKNRTASNTLRFINGRLSIISRELTDVEKDIQNYKTRSGIVDLSAESTVFLEKVHENDTQLNQVNIQLGALDEIEEYISSKSGKNSLAPATLGLENPVLTGLLSNLFELEMQREKLIKSSPEGSTAVQVIDNQIRLTKTNIADNTQSLRKILQNTRNKVTASNKKVEAVIQTIPLKERVLLDISRQQGIKGELYTYLLQKREETALSLAAAVSDLRIVDAPKGDVNPIKPRKGTYYLFALVLGILIPVTVLWLLDFLNDKVTRKSEIEDVTNVPIIGEVIEANITTPLEVSPSSRSLLSEQIRALRANIHFMTPDEEGPQTILVTSSVSGEGKSFISLNLGASMAITGRRVVLLELDLRKPKLHKYLGIDPKMGISNFLIGQSTISEIIEPVENYPDLYFIPCGPLPPNPSELLSSKRMAELFAALREGFDVIIADTPPIGLVSDAFSIAPHANITLYILRHLYTNKAYLKNIETLYQEKRFKNMSILINGIVTKKEYEYNYGYGYDSEYGYSNKAGYHNDIDKIKKKVILKGFGGRSWFNR
ncbi:polysaccharide biosynthesis tyrosine autokinase [Spirosoma taeanense]|uniref:Polysaccharide biosynthesis tyrosine autokinase n=1 Tax=Spirosoma taeanense TaxID=2735870 RepID=A0A6M5YAF5_9BACT|nr:polysaccharide biosynthesis tyrosine autokinase [Spirosoma taeanense]QJW91177.1 polysaccharide biosynthesis tyrosine autokinase [Spirosoma taeanense]